MNILPIHKSVYSKKTNSILVLQRFNHFWYTAYKNVHIERVLLLASCHLVRPYLWVNWEWTTQPVFKGNAHILKCTNQDFTGWLRSGKKSKYIGCIECSCFFLKKYPNITHSTFNPSVRRCCQWLSGTLLFTGSSIEHYYRYSWTEPSVKCQCVA